MYIVISLIMGEWIRAWDKHIRGLQEICLFRAPIHSQELRKKDIHSLYLQCFQQKNLSKIIQGKL